MDQRSDGTELEEILSQQQISEKEVDVPLLKPDFKKSHSFQHPKQPDSTLSHNKPGQLTDIEERQRKTQ